MKWYQIVVVVWLTLGVAVHLLKHGEPTKTRFNFYFSLVSLGVWVALLYCGGFWK